jgi:hypothetical protein
MTATELLQDAVVIVENSDEADEHSAWLKEARAHLKPALYDIISVDAELVNRVVQRNVKGESLAGERCVTLAKECAARNPNPESCKYGISGACEISVWSCQYRVMTYKYVKLA